MKAFIVEFIGTALLLAVVTGSGIMGDTLGVGNAAVALLGNSIATGAGLYVLITLLGPMSGAHFNPVVSLMFWRLGELKLKKMLGYWFSQFTGAIMGVWLTHVMFGYSIMQESTKSRAGIGIWVSELISTAVLLGVVYIGLKTAKVKIPMLVALTVTAGYWFTSSTFFSNPAVTVARSFTNTFVGISPENIVEFISAEIIGAILVLSIVNLAKNKTD